MSSMSDISPEVTKLVPGIVGAVGALAWIKEPWPKKTAMLIVGIALVNYGTVTAVEYTKLPFSFAGFLVGLFGMSLVDAAMKAISVFDLGGLLSDLFRSKFGLPLKER